jgi:hypothetical protein
MTYNIATSHPFLRTTVEADILPTPRLIDEGTRRPVEAYRQSEYTNPATGRTQGVWRVRDDSYDQPGTEYRWVVVEVTRDW